MAAVGFDLYSRLLAEAVEERKARREDRPPQVEKPQAVIDLPVEAHLPDDYVPEEAQKLELYRRLARARTAGDLAAFRQELTDRFGPMPPPVVRLVEVAELRLTAEGAGVASMSREEGQLVVRFGEGLTRATAMRLLAGGGLPGVKPSRHDVREQPGPDPAAARPVAGVGPDAGGRGAAVGRASERPDAADPRHSMPQQSIDI